MKSERLKGLTEVDQIVVDCELSPGSYEKNIGLSWLIFSYKAVWCLVIASYTYPIPMPPTSESESNFSPGVSALQAVVIAWVGACGKAWWEQLSGCEPCCSGRWKDWCLSIVCLSRIVLIKPAETLSFGSGGKGGVRFASCIHGEPQGQVLPTGSCNTAISLIHPPPPLQQQNLCLKRSKPCRWIRECLSHLL